MLQGLVVIDLDDMFTLSIFNSRSWGHWLRLTMNEIRSQQFRHIPYRYVVVRRYAAKRKIVDVYDPGTGFINAEWLLFVTNFLRKLLKLFRLDPSVERSIGCLIVRGFISQVAMPPSSYLQPFSPTQPFPLAKVPSQLIAESWAVLWRVCGFVSRRHLSGKRYHSWACDGGLSCVALSRAPCVWQFTNVYFCGYWHRARH